MSTTDDETTELSAEALDYLEVIWMHRLDLKIRTGQELEAAGLIHDDGRLTDAAEAVMAELFGDTV